MLCIKYVVLCFLSVVVAGLETNRESGENLLQMGAFMSFLQVYSLVY